MPGPRPKLPGLALAPTTQISSGASFQGPSINQGFMTDIGIQSEIHKSDDGLTRLLAWQSAEAGGVELTLTTENFDDDPLAGGWYTDDFLQLDRGQAGAVRQAIDEFLGPLSQPEPEKSNQLRRTQELLWITFDALGAMDDGSGAVDDAIRQAADYFRSTPSASVDAVADHAEKNIFLAITKPPSCQKRKELVPEPIETPMEGMA
jgi:hypothetical protein